MSRLRFSLILTLCFIWIILKNAECLYFNNYPKIVLPEKAHNTIGEIPLIEHIDDGQVTLTDKKVIKTNVIQTLWSGSVVTGDFLIFSGSGVTCDSTSYGGYR